jgi:hypothetical protein
METQTDLPASFDCRATAAVLRSGASMAIAGHVAVVMSVLLTRHGWITWGSLLAWCAMLYLAIRVKIDSQLFELLAAHPAEYLDHWLDATGLRKNTAPRTIPQRRRGALRLWWALVVTFVIQVALLLVAVLHSLA